MEILKFPVKEHSVFEGQAVQTKSVDESIRHREWSWLPMGDDGAQFGGKILDNIGEYGKELVGSKPEVSNAYSDDLLHIGQKVFLAGDQFIGLITKLFLNPGGQISHLAIKTARLLGRHKMIPITCISDVTHLRVLVSINREEFLKLPHYQADSTIAEEADRALWSDVVLRGTDYYQIGVRVRDGFLSLHGHVLTSMNQWRAETAVKDIPGILGVKSYLIPDDKLLQEVAQALSQVEQGDDCQFFPKIENGLAVLMGKVRTPALRDQAEQLVAEIPWVRGVINQIRVPDIVLKPEDQRFLQPIIGIEMLFKDSLSVIIQKVVINPHNRRVIAVVILGRFPGVMQQKPDTNYSEESIPDRLAVLPVGLIQLLTSRSGFIRIKSDETHEYEDFDGSRYFTPDKDWLPPYPYCTTDVLFQVESPEILTERK